MSDLLTTHTEYFRDNISELKPLFELHYREISVHRKYGIPLEPDYDKYIAKERAGELLFVSLRRHGRLVGYFTGFIGTALHYKGILQLGMDLIFVEPTSRGEINGQHGGSLLRDHVVFEAARRGVKLLTMGFKTFRSKHMEKLLKDGGFTPFEVHYGLWL